MREREPVTQTMNIAGATRAFDQIVKQVSQRETRVVVELEDGTPVAAIVSAQDLTRLTQFEKQHKNDVAILDGSQAAFQDVPEEELEVEIAKAIAEVRAEARAQRSADPA